MDQSLNQAWGFDLSAGSSSVVPSWHRMHQLRTHDPASAASDQAIPQTENDPAEPAGPRTMTEALARLALAQDHKEGPVSDCVDGGIRSAAVIIVIIISSSSMQLQLQCHNQGPWSVARMWACSECRMSHLPEPTGLRLTQCHLPEFLSLLLPRLPHSKDAPHTPACRMCPL